MKAVTSAFTENDDAQEALTAQAGVLTRQIETQEKKVQELKKGYEEAAKQLGENDTKTLKWSQAVYEATATLNGLKSQLSVTEKNLEKLGEIEAEKNLQNLDQVIKTLGSEMKAVTSAFTDNEKSQEALTAKANVLTKQIEAQKKKLEELKKEYESSAEKLGENDTVTLKWAQSVNEATAELNDLNSKMKNLGESGEKGKRGLDTLKVAAGNLLADGIETLISGIGDLISSFWNLDEATEEYRKNMGLLQTAFEQNGYNAETAKQAYQDLYAIIGDEGTATEAAQLMATLSQSQQDLSNWTTIAAGVWGTFGEALPINSLMEAANETSKTGQVVGVLADALNWAGISEDEFNNSLSMVTTESQRNQLIMNALGSTYADAAQKFYENNDSIVESRKAQAELDDTMADLGETIADIKTTLLTAFLPALQEAANSAKDFLEGVDAKAVAETIIGLVNAFIKLSPVIAAATTAMLAYKAASTISEIISGLSLALNGATTAQQGFNIALKANPIGAVISLVVGLISAFVTLMATNEDFRNAVLAVWDAITGAIGGAVDWIMDKFQAIKDGFAWLVDGVKDLLGINSPSKVFEDIGKNMAAGVDVGWDKEWSGAQRQIEGTIDFSNLEAATAAIQAPSNVVYVTQDGSGTAAPDTGTGDVSQRIDVTLELDGQVLARRMYSYNRRESNLRGSSLVEVGV